MERHDPRARPTLFVALVSLPAVLLLFLACGALGMSASRSAERVAPGNTPVACLEDRGRVPDGTYVTIDASVADAVDLPEPGTSLVAIGDAAERPSLDPNLLVYCGPHCSARSRRIEARVCDVPSRVLDCTLPKSLRDRATKASTAARVVFLDERPADARERRARHFAVAASALVGYVVLVLLSRRRRRGGARVADERTWTLPLAAEDVGRALSTLDAVDGFQIVDEGPGRMVFIQGRSENAARGWGVRCAEHFPRRAIVTWKSSPREPTQLILRLEEDLLWRPSALTPSMTTLARESIARTTAQVESALGVAASPSR